MREAVAQELSRAFDMGSSRGCGAAIGSRQIRLVASGGRRTRLRWAIGIGSWAAVLLLAATACGTAGSAVPSPTSPVEAERVQITRFVEGDTFDVVFEDGSTDRVRLLGVDAPETSQKNRPGEHGDIVDTECLDDWGDRAREFAKASLDSRHVALVRNPPADERDSFDQLLAYVEIDGRDFGAMLIKQGLARGYVEEGSGGQRDYLALEAMVRTSGAGLWSC